MSAHSGNVVKNRGTTVRGLVHSCMTVQHGAVGYGAGSGVMAGACCLGGAVIVAVGLSSPAAIAPFVENATPYFIAASIVMMAGSFVWIAWRMQFKLRPVVSMVIRHALIMGVIYGAIFAGSMALAAATGIKM